MIEIKLLYNHAGGAKGSKIWATISDGLNKQEYRVWGVGCGTLSMKIKNSVENAITCGEKKKSGYALVGSFSFDSITKNQGRSLLNGIYSRRGLFDSDLVMGLSDEDFYTLKKIADDLWERMVSMSDPLCNELLRNINGLRPYKEKRQNEVSNPNPVPEKTLAVKIKEQLAAIPDVGGASAAWNW